MEAPTHSIALDYFNAWTIKNFKAAASLVRPDVKILVPINEYRDRDSFMKAVQFTADMATDIQLVSEFTKEHEAMVVYDMTIPGHGILRVAEHFTIERNEIIQICQIHDTAPFRTM